MNFILEVTTDERIKDYGKVRFAQKLVRVKEFSPRPEQIGIVVKFRGEEKWEAQYWGEEKEHCICMRSADLEEALEFLWEQHSQLSRAKLQELLRSAIVRGKRNDKAENREGWGVDSGGEADTCGDE